MGTKLSFSENPATCVLTGQVLGHSELSGWFYSLKSTKKWTIWGPNQPFLAHSRHLEFENGKFPFSKLAPYISASFETERTRFRRTVLEKIPKNPFFGPKIQKSGLRKWKYSGSRPSLTRSTKKRLAHCSEQSCTRLPNFAPFRPAVPEKSCLNRTLFQNLILLIVIIGLPPSRLAEGVKT